MTPIRLTAVLTHPVQYYSPWFRHVTTHAPGIDLTVLYATAPTAEQQGVGFGQAFHWDVPLRDGYRSTVVRTARAGDRFDSDTFLGLDVPEISRAIEDSQPDVVLVPGWHSITLVRALLTTRRLGVPALFRGDTNLATEPRGLRGVLWRAKTRRFLAQFDGYLSPGQRTRAYLERMGIEPWQIVDVPHTVDNQRFAEAARPFQSAAGRATAREAFDLPLDRSVLLFVGKLEEKKRPLDVIRAAAHDHVGPAVLMVGAGPLEQACRAEASRLGVQATFTGFLNQSDLGRAYAAADMLVLPSDGGETWGLVVNEALATGLPVVVSDRVGCAPDLADDETGATFACGNLETLREAIERVRRRATMHDYATACRRRAERFHVTEATAGLVKACQHVARVPASRPRVVACCGNMVTVTGLERMTFTVLEGLRQRGERVHCVVNSWENHRIVPLAESIGATWSLGGHEGSISRHRLTPRRVLHMLRDIHISSSSLWRAARRVHATHVLLPDHLAPVRNIFALARLRMRGVRVVMHVNNAPDQGRFYHAYWRWLINPLVNQFICNSDFTLRELLTSGIPPAKAQRIYCALRTPLLPARSAAERIPNSILYVGQIIPPKGVDLLLEAVGLLNRRGIAATLKVAGDIDGWTTPEYRSFREALRARANESDLVGRVEFLGWRNDVAELMAFTAVHCTPSRLELREAFGVVNLEAKRAGVPSVVCPSGAMPEVVRHPEEGWVCRDVSAEALAEGLAYFLSDAKTLEAAGQAALRSVVRFDIDAIDGAWQAVFSQGPSSEPDVDAHVLVGGGRALPPGPGEALR